MPVILTSLSGWSSALSAHGPAGVMTLASGHQWARLAAARVTKSPGALVRFAPRRSLLTGADSR